MIRKNEGDLIIPPCSYSFFPAVSLFTFPIREEDKSIVLVELVAFITVSGITTHRQAEGALDCGLRQCCLLLHSRISRPHPSPSSFFSFLPSSNFPPQSFSWFRFFLQRVIIQSRSGRWPYSHSPSQSIFRLPVCQSASHPRPTDPT